MFSPFDFDVCTSPEEQEEASRSAREAQRKLQATQEGAKPELKATPPAKAP